MIQRNGVTRIGEAGLGACLTQPGQQALGVALQIRAASLRIQVDLPEREARFGAELRCMRRQVGLQLRLARLRRRGQALGNELHLLPQSAADDEVVRSRPSACASRT